MLSLKNVPLLALIALIVLTVMQLMRPADKTLADLTACDDARVTERVLLIAATHDRVLDPRIHDSTIRDRLSLSDIHESGSAGGKSLRRDCEARLTRAPGKRETEPADFKLTYQIRSTGPKADDWTMDEPRIWSSELPVCGDSETLRGLVNVLRGRPMDARPEDGETLKSTFAGIREVSFDEAAQKRRCKATVTIETQGQAIRDSRPVRYAITWTDRANGAVMIDAIVE